MTTHITHKNRKATITEVADRCHASGVQFQYSVWDQRKGFIASGFRRTHEEAVKVSNVILKAKG